MAAALKEVGSQVLRLPAVRFPKHYKEAYNLIKDTEAKVGAQLPHSAAPTTITTKADWLAAARSSPFPDFQQMAHNVEKADHNLVSALTYVPSLLRKDQIFPIALWKKVLPPVYVDAYAEKLVHNYKETFERSDVLPLAKEYCTFLTEQAPKIKADIEHANAQLAALKPRLQAVEARLLAIEQGTISVESLLAENPEIAREIGEELERGDWSIEGLSKEDEHDDHH
eukprot:Phypoly_transcript_17846.p1 GENE.Phypoly_transcript_17846~~Phypoly_transcript_17846.p1  ORF type:complete len:226 (+),score=52.58 Phypoly_transcript_17846:55-732(+)